MLDPKCFLDVRLYLTTVYQTMKEKVEASALVT